MANFISINESPKVDCTGEFKVAAVFSHDVATEDIRVTVDVLDQNNVQNLSPDSARPLIAPAATKTVTFSGNLDDIEQDGDFLIKFSGAGATATIDADQVRIVVPAVPIEAWDEPDPVTADPAGAFTYTVKVSCTANLGNHMVVYDTSAGGNIASFDAAPASPLNVNCAGFPEVVTVTGQLANPAEPGVIRFNFTTGVCRCKVITDILPNPALAKKARDSGYTV